MNLFLSPSPPHRPPPHFAMAPTRNNNNNNNNNNNLIPEPISRSSSVTVVSPVLKDGVDEIVAKLFDM